MDIIDRILEIVKDLGWSNRKFELSINKSQGYLNTLKNQKSNPTTNVLLDILNAFPDYSAQWLLTGKGEKKIPIGHGLAEESASYQSGQPQQIINSAALEKYIVSVVEKKYGDQIEQMQEQLDIRFKRSLRDKENNNSNKGLG